MFPCRKSDTLIIGIGSCNQRFKSLQLLTKVSKDLILQNSSVGCRVQFFIACVLLARVTLNYDSCTAAPHIHSRLERRNSANDFCAASAELLRTAALSINSKWRL